MCVCVCDCVCVSAFLRWSRGRQQQPGWAGLPGAPTTYGKPRILFRDLLDRAHSMVNVYFILHRISLGKCCRRT